MNVNYHVPMPKFDPTESDRKWVMENIAPQLYPALNIIKGAFDRVDLPQAEFINWPQREAVEQHFDELGIKIRRFAAFIGHPNNATRTAHIDGYVRGVPMIARFNIPIQGRSPATISWWPDDVTSDKICIKEFTELRNRVERTAYSYSSTISDWGDQPEYVVHNPGACWNRTELAHRPWAGECNVPRILITTETAQQISWADLTLRLAKLGYC
jgi:hypothetical protein